MNPLWTQYLFRKFTIFSLFFPRIHYEFTIFFANFLWSHYLFTNSLWIHFLFANSILIHYPFHDFVTNSLPSLRFFHGFNIFFEIWVWIHQISLNLPKNQFLFTINSRFDYLFTAYFAIWLWINQFFHQSLLVQRQVGIFAGIDINFDLERSFQLKPTVFTLTSNYA